MKHDVFIDDNGAFIEASEDDVYVYMRLSPHDKCVDLINLRMSKETDRDNLRISGLAYFDQQEHAIYVFSASQKYRSLVYENDDYDVNGDSR